MQYTPRPLVKVKTAPGVCIRVTPRHAARLGLTVSDGAPTPTPKKKAAAKNKKADIEVDDKAVEL